MKFTFGSDPECMIVNKSGKYVSAIGIIPGTKFDKVDMGGCQAFYDNVLAEVNISPGSNKNEVINNFRDCFQKLANLVGSKLKLVPQASQDYPKSECEHEDAKIFGCDPEYCAYMVDEDGMILRVDPPTCAGENTFRSGGGHIHLGHEICLPTETGNPLLVVKMMDLFVGMASILVDKDPTSAARRKLYGGAGTHRIKEYGLEYRTLSNFWISSPKLVELIYDLSEFVLESVVSGEAKEIISEVDEKDLRETINSGNVDEAKEYHKKYQKYLPLKIRTKLEEAIKTNVDNRFKFYENWGIKAPK